MSPTRTLPPDRQRSRIKPTLTIGIRWKNTQILKDYGHVNRPMNINSERTLTHKATAAPPPLPSEPSPVKAGIPRRHSIHYRNSKNLRTHAAGLVSKKKSSDDGAPDSQTTSNALQGRAGG